MTDEQFARFVDYVEARFQQSDVRFDGLEVLIKDQALTVGDSLRSLGDSLRTVGDSLRQEMRERFEIVDDRFRGLERGQADLRTDVSELRGRVDKIEVLVRENGTKLTDLKDEMQQRFRVVTERLSVLES
jgi:hypothetical protein